MTAVIVLSLYVLAGVISAAVLLRRGAAGPLGQPWSSLLVVALWPFLLPTAVDPSSASSSSLASSTSSSSGAGASAAARSARVHESRRARGLWRKGPGGGKREEELLDGFVKRLLAQGERLALLDVELRRAPASIQERLRKLREQAAADLDEGVALLDQLIAQLTLLQFQDLARPGGAADRDPMEELLARIEALVEAGGA